MILRQIIHNSVDYKNMVALRMNILRKPLGLSFSPEELEKEKNDILIGAFENDVLIGCCILSPIDDDCIKLRQMAVTQNSQCKGIGNSILVYAETLALLNGYITIQLHARETALNFYRKFKYKIIGEPFEEISITHYKMEKKLI